jgi:hypothetical protein
LGRDVRCLPQIPAQPHSGKVSPSELSNDMVAVVKQIANFHWVVAACQNKNQH